MTVAEFVLNTVSKVKNPADLQEEKYEWGSPGTEMFTCKLPEQIAKLARAAHRWRLKLSTQNTVLSTRKCDVYLSACCYEVHLC